VVTALKYSAIYVPTKALLIFIGFLVQSQPMSSQRRAMLQKLPGSLLPSHDGSGLALSS
jgi:hypothetical protein